MLEVAQQSPAVPLAVGKNEDAGGLTFEGLISGLHELFSSDRVDVDEVRRLMESYPSRPADWKRFAKFDRYRLNVLLPVIVKSVVVYLKSGSGPLRYDLTLGKRPWPSLAVVLAGSKQGNLRR
ncbi:hypothetical protein J437_LFUL001559 [Ladona fulva]|uniref:Cysteine dioxygenase n=1 Tax=Ladona fulva TaxID=123851 RepID=A0A8K0NVK7_LADFU|nr:hypothetical protein J437_LFUL001559 [Ladona fulva]